MIDIFYMLFGVIALITSIFILFGNPREKIYRVSSLVLIFSLIVTNACLLLVHGFAFSPFLCATIISLFCVFLAIRPFIVHSDDDRKLRNHIRGIVSSAIGAWVIFIAEIIYRTPSLNKLQYFFGKDTTLTITLFSYFLFTVFLLVNRVIIRRQLKKVGLLVLSDSKLKKNIKNNNTKKFI
jgi:hypothetical protein